MAENKKTTTAQTKIVADSVGEVSVVETALANQYVLQDVRTSVLIVSVLVNLIVLTTWIAIQVTTMYDTQVVGLLFNR